MGIHCYWRFPHSSTFISVDLFWFCFSLLAQSELFTCHKLQEIKGANTHLQSFPASGSFLSVCSSVNSHLLLLPYHWALLFPACQFSWSIYFVFTVWKLAHPALYSRLLCNLCFSVNYRADISVSGNKTQSGVPLLIHVLFLWPASHQCSQIPVRFFLSMWLYRRRKWQSTLVFLVNPVDRGAWWATVHGVAKSRTQLSD